MAGPSFRGRRSSSVRATNAARGSSSKSGSKPELRLRRAMWRAGLRYRKNLTSLPGRPDLVLLGPKIAIFCDGDFWHGRDWPARRARLSRGSNGIYWVEKISRNMARDRANNGALTLAGWTVLRFWESNIIQDTESIVLRILEAIGRS